MGGEEAEKKKKKKSNFFFFFSLARGAWSFSLSRFFGSHSMQALDRSAFTYTLRLVSLIVPVTEISQVCKSAASILFRPSTKLVLSGFKGHITEIDKEKEAGKDEKDEKIGAKREKRVLLSESVKDLGN